jgi:hypothetical protein
MTVKYMLMMTATKKDWGQFGTMAPSDIKAHIEFMHQLNKDLAASGELVDAQGLAPPEQAQVVRAGKNGGPPAITDGPFPEAKEFLAGYWVLDVRSPERAVEIAAKISAAPGRAGAPLYIPVELRQVGEAPKV